MRGDIGEYRIGTALDRFGQSERIQQGIIDRPAVSALVAQRLSADIRWIAAASPQYLKRFGTPTHPNDLKDHRCIRIRLGNDHIYQWEFERGGEAIAVTTPGDSLLSATPCAATTLPTAASVSSHES